MISYALVIWLSWVGVIVHGDLKVVHSWSYLQYLDEQGEGLQLAKYDYTKNIPVDVDVAPDGRMFVTVERKAGVPSSLNTVVNNSDNGDYSLTPYPDWSWTSTDSCDNIIAVFRITIDECNRLWVLDDGKVGDNSTCPPKLMAFDLTTNELVNRVDIPKELVQAPNGIGALVNIVVHTIQNCKMTSAYMADTRGNALLFWNGTNTVCIDSPFFRPEPDAVNFRVNDEDVEFERGLLGLALTKDRTSTEPILLYFRPLSSLNMYYAKAKDFLQENKNAVQYSSEPTKLTSQSVTHAFSSEGILFFNSVSDNSILCWNRHKPFTPENIVTVAQDDKTLQWVTATKVHPSDNGEMLWVMTNRYQQVISDTIQFDEDNFYVLVGLVDDLVKDTNCA